MLCTIVVRESDVRVLRSVEHTPGNDVRITFNDGHSDCVLIVTRPVANRLAASIEEAEMEADMSWAAKARRLGPRVRTSGAGTSK